MNRKVKSIFLVLVLVQGLHSIEEYRGKLWEVFPPATMLTSLVSENLETGFLIINIGLFIFGPLCWIVPIRREYAYANGLTWFWIVLEMVNGIGHPIRQVIILFYSISITCAFGQSDLTSDSRLAILIRYPAIYSKVLGEYLCYQKFL